MRRATIALSALSLVVVLVFAGTLFHVGATDATIRIAPQATPSVQQTVADVPEGTEAIADDEVPLASGTEEIVDEDVPLAAEPVEQRSGVPTFMILGAGIAFVVTFYLLRIRDVNASITSMNRKLFHK